MTKVSKPFPLKNILFKSTTASPATSVRTDFPRKNQTRSIEKSFATFLIPLLVFRAATTNPVPHFRFTSSLNLLN